MTDLFVLLESFLTCGVVACLSVGISHKAARGKQGEPSPPLLKTVTGRCLLAGVLCLVALVSVLILSGPVVIAEALESARDLTRKTFRERFGKEPEAIDLQRNPAAPYTGTARLGEEVWDVVVTRSGPQGRFGAVTMECTLTPRAK